MRVSRHLRDGGTGDDYVGDAGCGGEARFGVGDSGAWSASGVRAQVEAIKRLSKETDESLEEQSERISKWAVENVSYAAFQGQLKDVLRAVW